MNWPPSIPSLGRCGEAHSTRPTRGGNKVASHGTTATDYFETQVVEPSKGKL